MSGAKNESKSDEIATHNTTQHQQGNQQFETYAEAFENFGGCLQKGKHNKKTGEIDYKKVSSTIWPVAKTRDADSNNWGRVFQFYNPSGNLQEVSILQTGVNEGIQNLISRGLVVHSLPLLKGFLQIAMPPTSVLSVHKIGWQDDIFVLPNNKIFGSTNERVILNSGSNELLANYQVSGSLAEWQHEVAALCAGNSRAILSLSAAFSGPFLRVLGRENIGLNLWGETSSGKSTMLFAAGSVWGCKDFVRPWNTTGASLEKTALAYYDTVLCLDELKQFDPKKAAVIAYDLGNGKFKSRFNSGNANLTWRGVFISNGELSLAKFIEESGEEVYGGQLVRMLDIPTDLGLGFGAFETIHGSKLSAEFADLLKSNASRYYGSAGLALLERMNIPEGVAPAKIFIDAGTKAFVDSYVPAGSNKGIINRAAKNFGFIAAVGEYCIANGILPWASGQATWGAQKCFLAWLESYGDKSTDVVIPELIAVGGESNLAELFPADAAYWRNFQKVSAWEGVLLTLDIEPSTIADLAGQRDDESEIISLGMQQQEYDRRRRILGGAISGQRFVLDDSDRISLISFINWVKGENWLIPQWLNDLSSPPRNIARSPNPTSIVAEAPPAPSTSVRDMHKAETQARNEQMQARYIQLGIENPRWKNSQRIRKLADEYGVTMKTVYNNIEVR